MPTQSKRSIILIHDRPGSYSDRWIEECQRRELPFLVVDAYSQDIVQHLRNAEVLLWHWGNREPAGLHFARSIIRAAEEIGVSVFPNIDTCWHYDDKVAQSYLLDLVDAPVVPWNVFYNRREAEEWISRTAWPKVFKLRGGSGSRMVKLMKGPREALRHCRRMFGPGMRATEPLLNDASIKMRKLRSVSAASAFIRKLPKAFQNWRVRRKSLREQGFFYAQEFIPDNNFDTRITIIGDRAFGFRRGVRPGDFRASGSGNIQYDQSEIDPRCMDIAFDASRRLRLQTGAFDFVFDADNCPLIVEISYAFQAEAVHNCPGYHTGKGEWVDGHFWPQDLILDDVLSQGSVRLAA